MPIAGGLGLLVLLGGWLGIRRRRQSAFGATQNATQGFAETRQPSDTIFGPMGASDVDTKVAPVSTTMVYAPSQLSPTTGDVDPIAEANVYLAYNRDVQAEEILKAAKTEYPKRIDVQTKLLELYAKRRDVDSFNLGAEDLHQITQGEGADWASVRKMASDIGSQHPLFTPAAQHTQPPIFASTQPLSFPAQPAAVAPAASTPPASASAVTPGLIDFDLNHFSLDLPEYQHQTSQPTQAAMPSSPSLAAAVPELAAIEDPKLALAEEYLSIGDHLAARALIEQVIKQNLNPKVVTQAHQMLARLG
jgi:pilus assembly protein FimV